MGLTKPHSLTVYSQAMLTYVIHVPNLIQLPFKVACYNVSYPQSRTTPISMRPAVSAYKRAKLGSVNEPEPECSIFASLGGLFLFPRLSIALAYSAHT